MSFRGMWITFALLFAGAAWAQEIELQVELTKPVGTDISRKGDPISAKVLSPAALQGDTVEGKITDSKSSGKMKGQSTLRFTFETLKHGSETIPISSQVRSISNSKGRRASNPRKQQPAQGDCGHRPRRTHRGHCGRR